MTAQPVTIGNPSAEITSDFIEETISKLNALGSGTGVGGNFYPGAKDELKVRFGDHARGVEYVVLAPQKIAEVRAYMAGNDKPENTEKFAKISKLFAEADTVLARAASYAQEYHAGKAAVTLPTAVAAAPAAKSSAPYVRAA